MGTGALPGGDSGFCDTILIKAGLHVPVLVATCRLAGILTQVDEITRTLTPD